ncbi:ArnT family glycosyltransferase [Nocardia terpenica]|uniref:Mannosyltransferase n=1 Tax=Nocardia terpenica TaxID=455432 RepID=A0A164MT78_9NOCA|nr:glycosyltransferase family 39 protein [Nocardia terpenica]KZM73641.1 mannosyltransferase [Nocardia terpenica]NQE87133.1 glycosyltransferase family 39 protein [Nocardia terpenica]
MEALLDEEAGLDPLGSSPAEPALPPARPVDRLALAVLLVGTAVAYLWRIGRNDMADNFYAAAVWSGTRDWKALLFGSVDPGNFITVDKPPLSLWVMGLSARIFGFGSASMLVPQALMAVAAVALLYAAVTRAVRSRAAGLLAGVVLAVTPVVALMFRYNHPDAAMVLLMTAAAYATIRALPAANARWLALTGVALGFAFLAKMLEGLLVLPAFALAYLIAAPATLRTRLTHLVAAAAALIVSSGWYVLLTVLWPESSRPYQAGSTDNSFMDLVLGFNGFGRFLHGAHTSNQIALPPGYQVPPSLLQSFNDFGDAGPARLFTGESGIQISWFLPAALLAFALVLASRWRAPRTDEIRAAALVFGLWLVLVGAAFSVMNSIEHAYYTLVLAPAVAGSLAVGAHELWRRRAEAFGRLGGAALVATTGVWSFVLLNRRTDWHPELRWVVAGVAVLAAVGLVLSALPVPSGWRAARGAIGSVLLVVGLIAGLGGATGYAAATIGEPHSGRSPGVGPAAPPETGFQALIRGQMRAFADGGPFTDPRIVDLLVHSRGTWSAAVERSSVAAALELATRTPVIAIGGFATVDPVPSLDRFQEMVGSGQVSYYLAQELRLPPGWRVGGPEAGPPRTEPWTAAGHRDIADWVTTHFTATHVGNVAVYDLTRPKN